MYGNKYVLALIDHCSGWAEITPLPSKESENLLRYLEQEYLSEYDASEIIISNQGSEYNATPLTQYNGRSWY